VPLATIAAGLSAYQGTKGRMQRRTGPSGCVVIDDTYNANPDSMRAAIDWLATQPGRRLFVMGDMGELGEGAAAMHEDIGRFAATRCIDDLYALGTASAAAVRAFVRTAAISTISTHWSPPSRKACGPDTTLLVKGSRFMRMERVVARLADGAVPVKEH
jgi:UDP-N-acetylmuramoyl-tripeptide--D-alanyl-D-alanine ligase